MQSSTRPTAGPLAEPPARDTSQFGVVVFLASDVMLFASFFAAYFLLRANNPPWPPDDVELDVPRAALATAVLVSSSFTMVAADRAGEHDRAVAMRRWLLATLVLGAAFVGNQIAEYATLPFGADSHPYGSIYWLLTGLHTAHVTAGLGAIALLFVRAVRSSSLAAISSWTNGVSLYWHLVDVIWLAVFSTIWLMR